MQIANEQGEPSLVPHLVEMLDQSRRQFLHDTNHTNPPLEVPQLRARLHKLKNQFANLGCERASESLEQLYQSAAALPPEEIQTRLQKFSILSDQTLVQLREQI